MITLKGILVTTTYYNFVWKAHLLGLRGTYKLPILKAHPFGFGILDH
jgi:hypothetical protein